MIRSHVTNVSHNYHNEIVETDRHQIILNVPSKGYAVVTMRLLGSSNARSFTHAQLNEVLRYFKVAVATLGRQQEWT